MKKYLLFIMLACFYFSCSKDNKTTPPPVKPPLKKTYAVQFNVNATGSSTLKTNSINRTEASTPVPVSSFANRLQYWVYNSSGNLITQLMQTSSTTNFGQINDTFSPGTYTVIILAQNVSPYSQNLPSPPATISSVILGGNDTFFKNFSLTVSDSTVTQNVILNRVDGQLQIKITDSIPTAASSIEVDIYKEDYLSIATGLPLTTSNYQLQVIVPLPDSVKGKTNYTVTTYIANTTAAFNVDIYGVNSAGTKFVSAIVDSVTCAVNTRTLLSGALFSGEANYGFNITFNDTWSNTPIIIPFVDHPSPIIQANKLKSNN